MDGLLMLAENNLSISALNTVVFVPEGTGSNEHINRPHCGIVFEFTGSSEFEFKDKQKQFLHLKQGEILFLPKGSTYHVYHKMTGVSSCYCFNFDMTTDITEPFVYRPSNEKAILQRCQQAVKIWNKRNCGYYEQAMLELYGIISLLKQSILLDKIPNLNQRVLNPAIEYIETHYMFETISIGMLAEKCGISESYFRKLFKKNYLESPKNYIENLRLEKATELISTGEYKVGAIAGMCGFYNDSYFCKKFKQKFGVSPLKYLNIEDI